MSKGLFISTYEPESGKSTVCLGLMYNLLGKFPKVAYFKPIVNSEIADKDVHLDVALNYFKINDNYENCYGLTRKELSEYIEKGELKTAISIIIEKYKNVEKNHDFVLVEGSDFEDNFLLEELNFNIEIAFTLQLPVILVTSATDKRSANWYSSIRQTVDLFNEKSVHIISIIGNKVKMNEMLITQTTLTKYFPKIEINIIPFISKLNAPTMFEVRELLDATIIYGSEYMENQVMYVCVGAMQLQNFLDFIKEKCVIVTPGDRVDIIIGSIMAHSSTEYPTISGIILTGGLEIKENILNLIRGLNKKIPILLAKEGTFYNTTKITNIKSKLSINNKSKILRAIEAFNKYVNINTLENKIVNYNEPDTITPSMFLYKINKLTKQNRKKIVLPEGDDIRVLQATKKLIEMDIVDIVLLGDENEIKELDKSINNRLNFNKVEIINPKDFNKFNQYIEIFYELRKFKGMTMEIASDLMTDLSYFATMLVHQGYCDGMVSGAKHTTQQTIRPALQIIKTQSDVNLVSSLFFMLLDNKVSIFADCAINPNPTSQELAQIAYSTAMSAIKFGINPKIAMLSYSSGDSGKGEGVDKVKEATNILKTKYKDLKVEGPIQYDAAVDIEVAKSKLPNSEIAGKMNVLIFPDLNTGNNTYKAVQRETKAMAIGPMLQGLNKPVNDLSRGCTIDDIIHTVLITAIQAS